jgi:hypothetical protein
MVRKIVLFLLWCVVFILSALFLTAFFVSLKVPRMDRDFEEASKILPDITISTSAEGRSMVTIEHVRDWRYKKGEVVSKEYYDETFDVSKMKQVYLLFNPFGKWEGVGHFFFVFEFEDGKSISVSIEARRENSEEYSAIRGLFNEYELWYAFGSSEDFLSRRATYHDEELYKYPLSISTSSAQGLFLDLSRTAEELETTPGFYNTLTSNCTNLLADSANRVKKGSIPFHYSRLFTGFADDQLYDLGFIPHNKPFEEIYKEARIDESFRP